MASKTKATGTDKKNKDWGVAPARPRKVAPQPYLRIGFLVHDVSRMRRTLFDQRLKELNITRAQWSALAALSRRESEGVIQADLARELEVGKVTIGGLIDRLEASAIVERRGDPSDRRTRRVYITDKGFEIIEQMQSIGRELNSVIMKGLTLDQIHAAEDVLHVMKVNLREALKSDPDA
ncbi:MAG: MarR family transcriptional regulator [Sphingomonadales bacterium]|nr:MarR family transcriptional regulator [Sphingomonadales bacterium]